MMIKIINAKIDNYFEIAKIKFTVYGLRLLTQPRAKDYRSKV